MVKEKHWCWRFYNEIGEKGAECKNCGATYANGMLDLMKSIPVTTAASERTWSIRACVHTKYRNRLLVHSVDQAVFIKYNLALERKQGRKGKEQKIMEEDIICEDIETEESDLEEQNATTETEDDQIIIED